VIVVRGRGATCTSAPTASDGRSRLGSGVSEGGRGCNSARAGHRPASSPTPGSVAVPGGARCRSDRAHPVPFTPSPVVRGTTSGGIGPSALRQPKVSVTPGHFPSSAKARDPPSTSAMRAVTIRPLMVINIMTDRRGEGRGAGWGRTADRQRTAGRGTRPSPVAPMPDRPGAPDGRGRQPGRRRPGRHRRAR